MTAEMSGCNSSIVSLDHAEFAVHGTPPLPRGGSVWIAEPVITFFFFFFFLTAIYLYPLVIFYQCFGDPTEEVSITSVVA